MQPNTEQRLIIHGIDVRVGTIANARRWAGKGEYSNIVAEAAKDGGEFMVVFDMWSELGCTTMAGAEPTREGIRQEVERFLKLSSKAKGEPVASVIKGFAKADRALVEFIVSGWTRMPPSGGVQ